MSNYSYNVYSGDGSTTEFSIGDIPLIGNSLVAWQSQISVTVDSTAVGFTVLVANQSVVLDSTPAQDAQIVITRQTKIDDRYVDWVNSSQIDRESMNLDSDQSFFLAQEAKELAASAAQTTNGSLDAKNLPIINVALATEADEAVNLQQLNAVVTGGAPAVFTGQDSFGKKLTAADIASPTFSLPGLAGRDGDDINVFINGTRLSYIPGVRLDYSVNDFGLNLQLTISATLVVNDNLEVVWSTGATTAEVNPVLIDWSTTPNDVIPYTSISSDPADDGQFLKVTNGLPSFEDIVLSDITDFSTIYTTSLDAWGVPTSTMDMGDQRLSNVATAITTSDAPNWGQVLSYVNNNGGGGGGGGITSVNGYTGPVINLGINDLADVDTSSLSGFAGTPTGTSDAKFLKWSGSAWVPDNVTVEFDLDSSILTDLSDVNTGATNGQVLAWDENLDKWVPADQTGGGGIGDGTTSVNAMLLKIGVEYLVGQAPDGRPMYSMVYEKTGSVPNDSFWWSDDNKTTIDAQILMYEISNGSRRNYDSGDLFMYGQAGTNPMDWRNQGAYTGPMQVQRLYTKDTDNPVDLVPVEQFESMGDLLTNGTNALLLKAGVEYLVGQAPDGRPLYSMTYEIANVGIGSTVLWDDTGEGISTIRAVNNNMMVGAGYIYKYSQSTVAYIAYRDTDGKWYFNGDAEDLSITRYYTKDNDIEFSLENINEWAEVTLPNGGTTGQVLAKASSADADVTWVNNSGGGGGAVDSVNGQIGAVLVEEVPVGGNAGQVLAKASATDGDTFWAPPTAGVSQVNGQTGPNVVLDVVPTGGNPGDLLTRAISGYGWSAPAPVSIGMDDLTDVVSSIAQDGQVLKWDSDSNAWLPADDNTGGSGVGGNGGITSVNGVTDGNNDNNIDLVPSDIGAAAASHTHTHNDITDFAAAVASDAPVKNITAGSNVTVTELSGTYTISSTGGSGGGITSVNGDTGPTVVLDNTDVGAAATVHTHTASNVTDFDTAASAAAPIQSLVQGSNVTLTDDGSGNVTIASSGGGGGSTAVYGKLMQTVDESTSNMSDVAASYNTSASGNLSSGTTLTSSGIEIDTAGVYKIDIRYVEFNGNARFNTSVTLTINGTDTDFILYDYGRSSAEGVAASTGSTLMDLAVDDVVGFKLNTEGANLSATVTNTGEICVNLID